METTKRKTVKIILIVAGISAVLIIGINIFLSVYLKKIVASELKEQVNKQTNGLYHAEFKNIDVKLMSRTISLNDFSLFPDDKLLAGASPEDTIYKNRGWLNIKYLQLSNIDLRIKDKKISSVKNFHLKLSDINYILPDSLYNLSVEKVDFSWKDSTLSVNNFLMRSFVPQYQFALGPKNKKHTDWFEIEVGALVVENIHINHWLDNKEAYVGKIQIDNPVLKNFKNSKIEIEHNKMPLIYEQFQKLPFQYLAGNVKVNNFLIVYEELAKDGTDPGKITFTNMYGEMDSLTNIVTSHKQMNKLVASGKLMGEGEINAELYFPVDSTYDYALIKGTLGPMNMISLNSIIAPLAPARITGGFIQGMDYTITGGKEAAHINMCLLYRDLKADILSGDRHKNSFLTLLANGLIKSNNPDKEGEEVRRVSADHIRDPYHSSFNYLWKIYLSGLMETLGYTKQRQKGVEWVKDGISKLKGDN